MRLKDPPEKSSPVDGLAAISTNGFVKRLGPAHFSSNRGHDFNLRVCQQGLMFPG